jgi:hypothetical protein
VTKLSPFFLFVYHVFHQSQIMNKNLLILSCLVLSFSVTTMAQTIVDQPFSKGDAIQKVDIQKNGGSAAAGQAIPNPEFGEKCLQKLRTETLKETNEEYRIGVEAAKEMTKRIIAEFESGERAAPPIYTIPVVFHVIHKGEAVGSGTNLSTAQLTSAIDALNRDYRRTSANGGIAQGAGPDTEIQFCLAQVNPSGAAHSGINRVSGTGVSGYSSNGITGSNESAVKALSRWDNRYYLNIWVVSEIEGNGADLSNPSNWSGGTLGYAYLPTSPVTANANLDGIVAVNLCVGNDPNQTLGYRLWPWGGLRNRTLTHEVGHFLGLNHTFEGESCSESNCNTQGDDICDTPPTTSGSTCNSPACPNTQIANYMDYTEETCQNRFTTGQSTVMRGVLTGARTALVNTSNCGVSTAFDANISAIGTPSGTLCQTTFTPVVTLTNSGSTTLTSVQIQYFIDANSASTYNWTGSLASNASASVTLGSLSTTTGPHTFTARTVSGTLNGSNTDQVTSNDQLVSNFTVAASGSSVTLNLALDCFGEEITWEIRNSSNQLMSSGGPYVNNAAGQQVTQTLCLANGCYDFIINDSYGDGLYGSFWQNCTINGTYSITDGSSTLVTMTAVNGDFDFQATHNFCIGGGGTTVVCDDLMTFDGAGFTVNNTDFPNFDVQVLDVDQQAVNSGLAANGITSNWMVFYEVVAPQDTNFFTSVTSYFANTAAVSNDWLTFGPITMTSEGGEIRWKHAYSDNAFRDGYEVRLGTTGTAVSNFNSSTVLYSVDDNDPLTDGDVNWTQQTVALSSTYAGQQLYFAFHHNAQDMYFLYLDDIVVEGCSSVTVAIDENESFDMKVYPNPSTQNFTLQYSTETTGNIDLMLYNSVGQQVWSQQIVGRSNGLTTINTDGLSAGVYSLVVKGDKVNASKRLVLTN